MAALAFPLDLIEAGVFWRRSFTLQRRQEVSRIANGGSIRKEFGRPLWMAEYTTKTLSANSISRIRARIDSLDGGMQTFRAFDPARCRPIAYPSKVGLPPGSTGSGTLAGRTPDNKRITLLGMGNTFRASTGDLLQIGSGDLYSVVNGSTGGANGAVYEIEIRPFLWPGTADGSPVTFMRPSCLMAIDPASVSEDVNVATGRGTYSFQAWEVRPIA